MDDTFKKILDIAYNYHVSGQLEQAKSIYEKLLSVEPDNLNVLNLYAQLNIALKNYDFALSLFEKLYDKTKLLSISVNIAKVYLLKNDYVNALKIINTFEKPDIQILKLLAVCYMKNFKYENAVDVFLKLNDMNTFDFFDYYNLSLCYKNLKDIENSLKWAFAAYNLNPNDKDINLHLAALYEGQEDKNNELNYLLNVCNLVNDKEILYRIGVLYKQLNDTDKAVEYFNKVLEIDNNNKKALFNIAIIYREYDKETSKKILTELNEKYPEDISILFNLYILNKDMFNYDDCLKIVEKLIKLEPNNLHYSLLGDTFNELYKYDEAEEAYKKAIEINKDDIYSNLCVAWINSFKNVEEAKKILRQYPDNKDARRDLCIVNLREKNLQEVKYDAIDWWQDMSNVDDQKIENRARNLFYKFNIGEKYGITEDCFINFRKENAHITLGDLELKKRWIDEDVTNKVLLIQSKHGVGDLIMNSRYLYDLKKITKKLIIQLNKSCIDLYKYNFPDIEIYQDKDKIDEDKYDYSTYFMSILGNINADLRNIKYHSGYLSVENSLIKEKSDLEFMNTDKVKAGLFWQGNPSIYANRSIKLEKFSPLFDLKNIQLYSFQISKIDIESETIKQKAPIIDLEPYIKNYSDTAAFLKNIDVLITIDSSIAHLGGALGIKTYLLLPYAAEWRWFNDNNTTPWYDSIKIFKQTNPLDWNEVILRVKNELQI